VKTFSRFFVTTALGVGILAARDAFAAAPNIVSINPPSGAVVSNLTQITVTFSAPVAGVQPGDLIINEQPANALSGSGATYTFSFSQPPPSFVAVRIDVDTAITDLSGNPFDPFAAGASWSYTLADTIAPTVSFATPAAGATVTALNQIEVVFSEPVTGVDASDLRVNGLAVSGLTPLADNRYLFQFTQPASGTVNVTWSAGHGIQDLAPVPNGFAGTSWSYVLNPAAPATVVINEILAENRTSVEDADGQKQDWIELRNTSAATVSLAGWSLSDDPAAPSKWVFPNINLAAGQYLLVFASGKDRKTNAANATNHTNFRLNLGGGYVGLFTANYPPVAVSQLNYPEQRANISYGLKADSAVTYFSTPTPRGVNNEASAATGFVQPPHASVKSGFFNQPFNLYLSTETPGAGVRYTLDGSIPTAASELYTGPINIAGVATKAVVTVRAVGFKAGQVPSSVTTRTYIFPDHVLTQPANPAGFPSIWDSPCTGFNNCNDINPADYEMDPQVITNTVDNYRALARQGLVSIPTVSIVTDVKLLFSAAEGVYVRREPFLRKPVNAEFITPDGTQGFQIDCGLEMQGQTSPDDSSTGGSKWKSLKLGLRLFFQGEFGPTKLDYKVFEDSPVDSFDTLMLAGGHNNYWNYNNNDTQRTRAMYVRDQYVANLQNAMGGLSHHGRFVHLYLNGLYWGLYQLHERPDESFQASYQGGEKEEYDVFKHTTAEVVAGSTASYTTMWGIINSGLSNNANYEQLQQYLDIPDLINYLLANFWANNTDWAHKNLYASHRKQGGQWRFHAWDSEHVIATPANDFDALNDNEGTNPGAIFNRLLANAEFRLLLADHIHKHFFNGGLFYTDPANPIYNPAFPERNRPADIFMKMLQQIDTAIVCESARWGDVGPGRETNPHTRNGSFYEERDILMGYRATFGLHSPVFFPGRSTNLMNQFRTRGWYPNVVAPSFNQHGGRVAPAFNLTMTAPAGTIYYTTNGTDPRAYGSGAVAPAALAYTGGAVTLSATMVVKARTLSGTNWSALNEAAFLIAELVTPLRLTEIMYNPPGGDAFEFIELLNAGAIELNLGGYTFDGISFTFPPAFSLPAGARIVLASDAGPSSFAARYPGVVVSGYFGGALANGGERIALADATGRTVLSVDYDDENGWPTAPDGGGYSLEIVDTDGDPDDPANWRASNSFNGTPGQVNSTPPAALLVLNEVQAENLSTTNNGGAFPDWVELYNSGASPVDLTGWSLSDGANPRRFVFASGPVLPAGGYLVVWCDTNSVAPGIHTGFALDKDGSSLFLYDPSTNRVDAVTFGPQAADYSIGRLSGNWQLNTPTPGKANTATALAAASNLVINEWLANTVPGGSDWLELYNGSAMQPVALKGIYLGTSNALFQIKSLSFLAPNGFIQLLADEQPGPGHLDFKLAASGGAITLADNLGVELNRVTYGNQAQGVTQGRLPDGAPTIVAFPGSASPAASNYLLSYSGPFLNEVLARNESTLSPWAEYADWIEIANTNAVAVDLSGLSVSDSIGSPGKWVIPSGTTVGANSYLRVWCDGSRVASTNSGPDLNTGFSLSSESGGVYLFSAAGVVADSVEYGFQVADLSLGRSAGQWRLLASATPGAANSPPASLGAAGVLRINEWLSDDGDGNDWLEIYNTGGQPVDLSGLFLTDDPTLTGITQHQIAPFSFIGVNACVVFEADGDAGQGRNHVNFNLDNLGDSLRLYAPNQALIDAVDFGPLPETASGGRLPDGAATVVQFSTTPSPGESNYLPLPEVVIDEALTHTDLPLEDAIELFNPTASAANIGGFYLSDSKQNFKKYRVADGTTVAAGGFKVFYQNQFNSGAPGSFALNSARGGKVYLSAADGAGNLTGYRAQVSFGAAQNGASFGRYPTSVGADFPAASARSFGIDNPATVTQFRTGTGAPNPYPKIGPVVFNELMYHPVTGAGINATEDGNEEFVELHNLTSAAVSLFDQANPGNTWRLRGGIEFNFPPGVSLPAKGYLLVVAFNPATDASALANFRAKYGLPLSVPIHGPFSGKLDNAGESIELYLPDTPQGPGPDQGYVPYVLVDRVDYADDYPWPPEADGTGASLQRRRPDRYGNDPVNWKTLGPTAGRANVAGSDYTDNDSDGLPDSWEQANGLSPGTPADATLDSDGDGANNSAEYLDGTNPFSAGSVITAPSITTQPQSQTVIPGGSATFSVAATNGGAGALNVRWRFNGLPIPGETNFSLVVIGAGPTSSGFYSAVVWNSAGFALSQSAKLTVNIPPSITLQPQPQAVNPGQTAMFSVAANGTGSVRYQWRFNGMDIAGATGSTLTIPNAQLGDEGEYSALVNDDAASISSAVVRLMVRVLPTILIPPQSVTNTVGSTVTFSVKCSGSVPMAFFWRKGAIPIVTNILYTTNDSLTLSNIQLTDSGTYRVIITNSAIASLSTNATAFLQVLLPVRLQEMQVLGDGSARMKLSGSTNRSYAVEMSSNLTNWTTLTNLFYTNGLMPFIDASAVGATTRFYRARLAD
jgi:hypothetical protein